MHRHHHTYDKIVKTKWLIEAYNELCGQFQNVEQNLCVNEMVITYTRKYSPPKNIWKLNLVAMEWKSSVWLMPNPSLCKKWKCMLVQVMMMLNTPDTRLCMGWWTCTRTSQITLSHVTTFSLTLHCFGIFWRLRCTPQELTGLIVRVSLVL
jgi:hypothetical protein